MEFNYEYRNQSNELMKGAIRAKDRDEVFTVLKSRGIRPSRVTEAPGFLNKLFGKGKRWLVILFLGLVCLALVAVVRTVGEDLEQAREEVKAVVSPFDSQVRRQLLGDAAVIDKGIRTGWSDVFEGEGERFLASFAIPGVSAGQRSTTEEEIKAALGRARRFEASDSIEARQIIAMVEGMKEELRDFLGKGGTIKEYGERLVARQEKEKEYYARAKNELEVAAQSEMPDAELEALWEKRNGQLRKLGIRLLAYPE